MAIKRSLCLPIYLLALLLLLLGFIVSPGLCEAWTISRTHRWAWTHSHRRLILLDTRMRRADDNTGSDDDEDWRDFRARLVAQEKKKEENGSSPPAAASTTTPNIITDSITTTWAYETGDIIEQGSVILSRYEQDFCCGIKQQYFHKSIMLVLEHDDGKTMTDGIILNRPSARRVMTDEGGNNSWNIWYGGPLRGMDDEENEPSFRCLHSLTNDVARRVSNKIIKNIQWTTLSAAQFLVREKHAVPEDFQVYCGFAGWSPGQLQRELDRNNWYMASVDSQTILHELLDRTTEGIYLDVFGLETWKKFAERIGRVDVAAKTTSEAAERFDDCMLLEWIRAHLLLSDEDDTRSPVPPPTRPPGTILRASAPFLLDDQEFHKSLLLVLEDNLDATLGVLLNLPGANSTSVGDESIPIRYGGKYGIRGQSEKPLTWYHNDDTLREAQVGNPLRVGASKTGIWTCTREDAETAIEMGMASLDDFLVIRGTTVLKKANDMNSLAALEKFAVVPSTEVPQVWDALLSQEGVTRGTLNEYMVRSSSIWALSEGDARDSDEAAFQEEMDGMTERDLSSVAWKSWCSIFLLGDRQLRGS